MSESREVCQICYRSTSHKASPTLTPESKATYDTGTKKKKCTVCRQGWAPIRIGKDTATGKWAEIRTRPKIPLNIDYQLCKSCQSRVECPKGLECSFAHSKIELTIWNAERQSEPRPAPPINGPYQYQLCKHILNTGSCPFGQRCTFAHSEEERTQWLRTQTGADVNGRLMAGAGYSTPHMMINSLDFKCDACGLTCTSAKQLEDHLAGTRHRQMVSKPVQAYQYPPPPRPVATGHFRRRPTLSFPINGYKMCRHIQSGMRCIFGDFCTFAHTQLELDEWNKQLQVASRARTSQHINRFQTIPPGPTPSERVPHPQAVDGPLSQSNTASGLDDFDEEGLPPMGGQDFGSMIRDKILGEHNKKESLTEFEGTCEGVTVVEVTGRGLCLLWSKGTSIEWVFEITTTSPRTLHSVTLFDSFLTDYDITGVYLITHAGQQKLPGMGKCEKGVGLLLNQRFGPSDKIQIKVTLVPRSGLLGQLVVFDFGSFTMIRGLAVHILTEQESKMLDTAALKKKKAKKKPDLFWEQHHSVVSMNLYTEETDKALPDYPLPEQIEKFIEGGKYRNVEARVTRVNYQRRMHNLLYLEEYKQREDMSRYDLYDVEVTPLDSYSTDMGSFFPQPGHTFLRLQLEEALFEGGQSVRPSDCALLWPSNARVVHECNVEHVAKEWVILRITDRAKADCATAGGRCSIRFQLGRIPMRSMHFAVDNLDLSTIFPESLVSGTMNEHPTAVLRCLEELKRSELNKNQQDAITSMLDPVCTKIPSLVLGPFGCGKTRTLSECIKLLALLVQDARILICTHNNSAADLYVESLNREWRERLNSKAPLFRLYYTGRDPRTISPTVRQYCKFNEKGELSIPSLAELQSHKITVATTLSSRSLLLSRLPKGHFTHIFIDEAAQALESECVIPLCLAGDRTKVVLAGDHMQMDPPVYSPIAKKYGLHVSLLERLYDHEAYESGVGILCKTLLTENHRSHQMILELPSKLFYKNKLTCKAVLPNTGPQDFPPIKFVGVNGREGQSEDSPSYYNDHEVLKIAEQVQLLVYGGLNASEICVVSYYRSQVQRIRHALRQRKLGSVAVVRTEDVQGKEFRALILSTVRTCSTEPPEEEEAGFLTNPKMFNTTVTRAKQWLVVVGEPFTLCTVGENRLCWMEFIRLCQTLKSFDYTNADQFVEESLDYKIVVRQLLEKVHSSFFSPNKPPTLTPAAYSQAGPQKQMEILRSKVKQVTLGGDDPTIKKITDELMRLSVEQQVGLIAKPELFAAKVKEIEQVFRRAGPTAAILNSNRMEAPLISQPAPPIAQGVPRPPPPQGSGFNGAPGATGPNMPPQAVPTANGSMAALTGDLPPYLRNSMESVAVYARWVEHILRSPLVASPEIRENMLRQQANVNQQLRLVNEQIFLYRAVCKLIQFQMRAPQSQVPQPATQPMATPPVTMATNPAFAPTAQPPPQMPSTQSQSYQLFSQPNANPGHQTVPLRPPGPGVPGTQANSAFTYGVSALLPNTTDPLQSQPPQPSFVAGIVKGGRTANPVRSLNAAISAGSTPSVGGHRNDQELYVSDEELFN